MHACVGDVVDVRVTRVQALHAVEVQVESDHLQARGHCLVNKWQADVPEAHDDQVPAQGSPGGDGASGLAHC